MQNFWNYNNSNYKIILEECEWSGYSYSMLYFSCYELVNHIERHSFEDILLSTLSKKKDSKQKEKEKMKKPRGKRVMIES